MSSTNEHVVYFHKKINHAHTLLLVQSCLLFFHFLSLLPS